MNLQMIRENQKLVDSAYDNASEITCAMVNGNSSWIGHENQSQAESSIARHGLDLDRAIKSAHKCLSALLKLQYIRDAEVTVNLSLSDEANGLAGTDTPVLVAESPVIRSLPVTDKITPIIRRPHPLQVASAAS